MHVKRQTISKNWPIPRKGTKYVVVNSHDKKNGIPLLVLLRDVLKIAKNRKEVKRILQQGLIFVNNKKIREENLSIVPFDLLKIGKTNYELGFSEKGKLKVKETNRKEIILKVVDKKILKNKKIQLNLLYGRTLLTEKDVKTGDSVVIKEKKIDQVLSLEKGKDVVVLSGKHKGKEGKIETIEDKIAIVSSKDEKISIPIKNIMVMN